jgi:hypothetical protein
MVVAAQTIRYRRELKKGDTYRIRTRLAHFNDSDRSFYIESKFLKDDFTHAISLVQYRLVEKHGRTKKGIVPSAVLRAANWHNPEGHVVTPNSTLDLWIKSLAASKAELNPQQSPPLARL